MEILFVSIAFPPKNNPECLQTGKYFKYLDKNPGVNISVLTSPTPTLFMPYDPSLEKYLSNGVKLVEIGIPENKYLNYLIRKVIPTWLQLPDSKFLFHRQWRKAIKMLKKRPDIIYSRSFPLSSSIMAYRLARYFKVPWVMHLSDPWVDNPLDQRTSKSKEINTVWERECFELARYITFTSFKTIDFYKKKYPALADKFLFMPNVYDPEDIIGNHMTLDSTKKLRIVYTGGLTENRTAEPLFKALQLLEKKEPKLLEKIEITFAGQFDRKNTAIFGKYNLPCVLNVGLLSFDDAKKLLQSAHVLLAIDSPALSEDQALFFPSKLLDYIASKKKVIAITDLNSTTYEVIQGKYGDCIVHKDIEGLAQLLKEYVQKFQSGETAFFINEIKDDTFSASTNAVRLIKLFRESLHC